MEALASDGYRTLLFLEPPSFETLNKFKGIQCIGIAGMSRAMNSQKMEQELHPIFNFLFQLPTNIIHYKTCSTFDSSPEVGSIGRAIELAQIYISEKQSIPLFVAAPKLGRYTVFGQHYARVNNSVYRLDRHPTMSKHPVTPMREADLSIHLKKQLSIPQKIDLMNVLELNDTFQNIKKNYESKKTNNDIVLFDSLENKHEQRVGKLIWERNNIAHPEFVVGSSGVEYALKTIWEEEGIVKEKKQNIDPVNSSEQILVVSGSGSPITKQQIENAIENGFKCMHITPEQIANAKHIPGELFNEILESYNQGESIILYTTLGPDDSSIIETRRLLKNKQIDENDYSEWIGNLLGKWTKKIIQSTQVDRIVIAGGDTSGFVTKNLGIFALEMLLPISPGAPLCKGYVSEDENEYIEIALKGGQLGGYNYFSEVKNASNN